MEPNLDELRQLVQKKIDLGEVIKKNLQPFLIIDGGPKFQRKVNQELKFLNKIKNSDQLKINHLLCSNLNHFNCLVEALSNLQNVVNIDYSIPVSNRPLHIDIVCNNGGTWIKVIARNSKSLNDTANGRSSYGTRNILDQAREFIIAAKDNLYLFEPPKVRFKFAHQIDEDLKKSLEEIGVEVMTNNTHNDTLINPGKNYYKSGNTLNLDITTLIAFVSALTNDSNDWEFVEPMLTEQACWERERPIKPILLDLFTDKRLICCETAVEKFKEIISTIGGPNEKKRANELINQIEILPNIDVVPRYLEKLNISGQIKPRSLVIFSFGIAHKAVTVTANEGFVRSAKMKGINIPVFIHEARALTEQKEATGTKLNNMKG